MIVSVRSDAAGDLQTLLTDPADWHDLRVIAVSKLVLEEVCRLKGKRSLRLLLTAVLLVLLVCSSVLGLCAYSDVLVLYPMAPMVSSVSYDSLSISLEGDEGCEPVRLGLRPGVRRAVHRLRLDLIRYGTGPPLG